MTNLVVSPETLPDILEIWVPVKNYEKEYHISNMGRVKRISKHTPERILKIFLNSDHYPIVTLSKNNVQKTTSVHRMVAIHFIEKPKNWKDLQINHIDGIKSNCVFSNLEWCTQSHNIRHAYRLGLMVPGKVREHRKRKKKSYRKSAKTMAKSCQILMKLE